MQKFIKYPRDLNWHEHGVLNGLADIEACNIVDAKIFMNRQ